MTWQEFLNGASNKLGLEERFQAMQHWDGMRLHPYTDSNRISIDVVDHGNFLEYTLIRGSGSKKSLYRDSLYRNKQLVMSF